MPKPTKNPGFQHPLTRVLLGIGAVAMLVSGIMDLSGSNNETLSLVLKLVAVLFIFGALGAGFALNKKLQQSQQQGPQQPPFQQPFQQQRPQQLPSQPPAHPHQYPPQPSQSQQYPPPRPFQQQQPPHA